MKEEHRMKAWLVVNAFLQQHKFQEIHQWLYQAGVERGIDIQIKTNAELLSGCMSNRLVIEDQKESIDFVLFWDKDVTLAKTLEQLGFVVFNSAFSIEVCDNKALTHMYLAKEKIPMPNTIFAPMTYVNIGYTNTEFLDSVIEQLGLPIVLKECYGSFGQQVYLCENRECLEKKVLELQGKELIFQHFLKSAKGRDVRLQVVGNQVIAAMERTAKEGDFRANVSNGGSMAPYKPSEEEKELAVKCCNILKTDFAGVDLIKGEHGETLVCEVNSNAHFKNIFDCTGVNAADFIMDYIQQKMEKTHAKASVCTKKKRGWLVYDRAGAEYNKAYIQMHFEEAEKLHIQIELVYAEEITFGVKDQKPVVFYKGNEVEKPDFVICRTIYPFLSNMLERAGFLVFNNAKVAEIANDKAKTYSYLANHGIPMVDSIFIRRKDAKECVPKLPDHWVVKAVDGHGGKQVFLKEEKNVEEILEKTGQSDLVAQPFLEGPCEDVRVYVLGKEILACVRRHAKNGFKSNFSLGGEVELYTLTKEEKQLVQKIIDMFSFGLVGIDFLIDAQGALVFNEIEDVVGARMLYQLTDINLVERYLTFILKEIGEEEIW